MVAGQRLCIVPRWAGRQSMEWYPWLCRTELVRARFAELLAPDIDDPGTPTIDAWVTRLTETCGDAPAGALERTWFVGHSVGCQAIVRYLASLPPGARVAGCLLVAGWWTVDQPWPTIRPWLYPGDPEAEGAPPLDLERARAACPRFSVLISDNDPFTADHLATEGAWRERLGAEVTVAPGAKHFNATESAPVRDALAALLG